jgi:phenylacetate-CoA ligase
MFTLFDDELAKVGSGIVERHRSYLAGEWSAAELAAYQAVELRATLAYARERSPFYRRQLAGVDLDAVAADPVTGLATVPFTTKNDLRRELDNVLCRPLSEAWIFYETTGTTGRSTPCPRDNVDSLHNNAMLTFAYRTIFAPERAGRLIGVSGPTELHAFGDTFGDVCRNLGLAVAKMWPHSPMVGYDRALRTLRELGVTGLFSTPGMALALAKKADAAGLDPGADFRLDTIMCTGELASASLLANVGEVWGARAYNALYASQEASVLAAAGVDGDLYTAPVLNFYEVIDESTGTAVAPGPAGVRVGELVVTALYQGSKPLIRYRTGDLVRHTPARPGAALPSPTLQVLGRTRDTLTVGGHPISGLDLEDLLLRHVRRYLDYQVIIGADDVLTLRLEPPRRGGVEIDTTAVRAVVRDTLDVDVTIELDTLDPVTTTGAMVSWKAARVEDRRLAVPDVERAAALELVSGRAR